MTYQLRDGREIEVDRFDMALRYNVYECAAGHLLLSADVDQGVTPMFKTCMPRGEGCGRTGSSWGYPAEPPPPDTFPVRYLWRKATAGELKRERREGGDHYQLGGLALETVP